MAEAEAQQAVNEQQPQSEEITEQNQVEQETQEISEVEKLQEENRKWQSMYDKATADNTKMQTIMADYLETQKNAQPQQQVQQENIQISEEEFNPWDAYYKPNSPSYKMRTQREQQMIHNVVDQEIAKVQNTMTVNNTRNELRQQHNLNDNEVNEFMDFVSQPKDAVPIASLVKLWKETTGKAPVQNVRVPSMKQPAPRTAGVQSNQAPVRRTEESKMWDGIVKTGSLGKLP